MTAIDTENQAGKPEPEIAQPKGGRKPSKKTTKKAPAAGKAASKAKAKSKAKSASPAKAPSPVKAEGANKKADVIAMLKRAKGATLAEIMAATRWQAHTVRGFVSILGSKGGERIESSKNAAGERTYKIG